MAMNNGFNNYFSNEVGTMLLTRLEERRLGWRVINDGDVEARDELIKHNFKLMLSIAGKFKNRGLELADIISEGTIGLLKAAEKYDPAYGTKFSTYATKWIEKPIRKAILTQTKTVVVPIYIQHGAKLVRKFHAHCVDGEFECSYKCFLDFADMENPITEDAYQRITKFIDGKPNLSLDINPDKLNLGYEKGEGFEDMDTRDLVFQIFRGDIISEIEKEVLKMRFGYDGQEPMTLQQISNIDGLSRERIRQVEHRACGKIRDYIERRQSLVDGQRLMKRRTN